MPEPLTEEQRAATPCLVAYCAECGLIVACSVQVPEHAKDTAKEVARWVKAGLTVTTLPVADVRTGKWCDCHHQKQLAKSAKGPKD